MAEPTRGPLIEDGTALVTCELALTVLDYDPETGHFWWKFGCQKGRGMRGKPAGATMRTECGGAYRTIMIRGIRVMAHCLAWYFVHRQWLSGKIDHINLDGCDNRISNLRIATYSQNLANRRVNRNNTSGAKGVSRHRGKWAANIGVDGKLIYLGVYQRKTDAIQAYRSAAARYYGEFARVE